MAATTPLVLPWTPPGPVPDVITGYAWALRRPTWRPSRPRRRWPGSGGANGTEPRWRHRALQGESSVVYFASSIFLAVSAPAFFASAFSPAAISLTSTTTLRMMPVNFVLPGW